MATYETLPTGGHQTMAQAIFEKIKNELPGRVIPVIGTQTTQTGAWTGDIPIQALYDGLTIAYYLPYAGSGYATLNLTLSDGTTTGAVDCYFNSTTRLTTHYGEGSTILLTYWSAGSISINGTATTNNRWTHADYYASVCYYGTCTTAAATAAKAVYFSYYIARANNYFLLTLANANTAASALTLNVNSTGAKPLYINGEASSSSNYTLPAGTYWVFYDGTNYYVRTDGRLTANILGDAETVNRHTVDADVPSGAKFTDTTYDAATTSAAGLLSAADKSKLNGIEAGAQVNAVTSVNGETGAVSLDYSDVGAAASSHVHSDYAPLASPAFTGTPTTAANTSYTTRQVRSIILSTSEPTASDGQNGDIWLVYEN